MNRTDRLYAIVEELRAAGADGRTAAQLVRDRERGLTPAAPEIALSVSEIWRSRRSPALTRSAWLKVWLPSPKPSRWRSATTPGFSTTCSPTAKKVAGT